MRNKLAVGWFLLGIGSQLQIIASLSFTELFVFLAAPIWFGGELPYLRRNKMMVYFNLSICLVLGAMISCIWNRSELGAVIRGMAVVCCVPCSIVVGHRMLRRNMDGFKWMLLGGAISGILCTFVFQKSVEVSQAVGNMATAGELSAEIMRGPIYWLHRGGAFLSIPAKGWYLQCPLAYCICAPFVMSVQALITTASGRGPLLGAIASAVMVLIGGKTQQKMRRICKYFWALVFVGIIGVFVAKTAYQFAAENDYLGEKARKKYEGQTRGGKGLMALLMGGRMESFIGFYAACDRPIVGFGPWARDTNGYVDEFLRKYGNADDYANLLRSREWAALHGRTAIMPLIPAHSCVGSFWLSYGIVGLVFWIYAVFVLVRYLRQDCWVVPQWFMWLAASIPGFLWDAFFNPYASRVGTPLFLVACLMARAVRLGRQPLPLKMVDQIRQANRR